MLKYNLALGLWEIGGYPFFNNIKEDKSVSLIRHAIRKGVKYFDTAPVYGFGKSEKILGKAIVNNREDIIISTKCGLRWKKEKLTSIYKDSSKKSILEEIDLSLKRLNTDYIDIYYIHWPDIKTSFQETSEALNILIKKHKIKSIGLSNFKISQIKEFSKYLDFNYLQAELNILDTKNLDIVNKFISKDKYFFAYSPIARGLLTDNYEKILLSNEPAIKRKIKKLNLENHTNIIQKLKILSQKYDLNIAQLAIKYLLQKKNIIPIIGTTNKKHLDEMINIQQKNINELN